MRLDAARAVKRLGFVPGAAHLRPPPRLAGRLRAVPGRPAGRRHRRERVRRRRRPGQPRRPVRGLAGPDRAPGCCSEYGVRHVGISGYPEGHPAIDDRRAVVRAADKHAALAAQRPGRRASSPSSGSTSTRSSPGWRRSAGRASTLPIRIGVPGPAGVRRLMSYATRFGVGTSASIAKKYGFSITNLMGTAGPDRFLRALADGYDPAPPRRSEDPLLHVRRARRPPRSGSPSSGRKPDA